MVNFRDPAVIVQDSLAVHKFWHTVSGLFIWEFFTTLEYEWDVLQGRRPYRWTIWVYSIARLSTLIGVVLGFVLMDTSTKINCQVGISFVISLSFLSTASASLLIVLRIIAIWNRKKLAMWISLGVWGCNAAFLIQGAVRLRSGWVPASRGCVPLETESSKPTLIAMLVTDVTLLLIMLVGLLRLRYHRSNMFGLTQLLWRQGLIWLLIATVVEVPPVVFIALNLNVPFNVMFQPPAWITMVIAATRMHRSLVDFTTGSSNIANESFQDSGVTIVKAKRAPTTQIPLDRMDVTVHVVSGPHLARQMRDDDSCASMSEQAHKKQNGLVLENDLERGM